MRTESIVKDVKSIAAIFKEYANDLTSKHDEELKAWEDVKTELGKHEKEIQLDRIITAVLLDPTVAKQCSLEYGERFINLTYWLCRAKGFNPKVKITKDIEEKYGYPFRGKELDLIDLLKWSLNAWEVQAAGGSKHESRSD